MVKDLTGATLNQQPAELPQVSGNPDPNLNGAVGNGRGNSRDSSLVGNGRSSNEPQANSEDQGTTDVNFGDLSGGIKKSLSGLGASLGIPEEKAQQLMKMMGLGNAIEMIEMFGTILNKLQEHGAHASTDKAPSEAELGTFPAPTAGTARAPEVMPQVGQ